MKRKIDFSFAFLSFIRTFVRGMKVLIVNTSEQTGGAAVAANRLMDALNNHGVKAKMLVRDKQTGDKSWRKGKDAGARQADR